MPPQTIKTHGRLSPETPHVRHEGRCKRQPDGTATPSRCVGPRMCSVSPVMHGGGSEARARNHHVSGLPTPSRGRPRRSHHPVCGHVMRISVALQLAAAVEILDTIQTDQRAQARPEA